MRVAVKAAQLIDGTGAPPVRDGAVVIEDGTIAAVGEARALTRELREGEEVIDLGERTLLPGLVDAHTHLGLTFGLPLSQRPKNEQELTLRAARNARTILRSGVTTARLLSERNFLDVTFRRAIAADLIPGPRLVISTRGLQTAHSDTSVSDIQVDGVDEVRRAVRQNVLAGTDWIKIFLTPAGGDPHPTLSYFSREEIVAAVEEAHRAGRPVAAHCHGGEAVRHALDAGVDTIEHALWFTDEQFAEMAERGTWLIGTQTIRLYKDEANTPPNQLEARRRSGANVARARERGVKIAVGTDGAHGLQWFEVKCLIDFGCPPMEAIQAATRNAAQAIGLGGCTGTLEAGKWADMIAVVGDPLEDIAALARVTLVIKGGRRYDGLSED